MKRTLFKWFNILMACIVLLSSTGFGLVEHSCQMRGKKKTMVVAFSEVKTKPGCQSDQQLVSTSGPTIKKMDCCQDDQHYENVDTSSSLSQLVAKFVKVVTETVIHGVVTVLAWLFNWAFTDHSSSVSVFSSPPSLSGRDILTLVRCLLI
ncbi:HYC_CC_PP family protein [Spirosoma gilvum]